MVRPPVRWYKKLQVRFPSMAGTLPLKKQKKDEPQLAELSLDLRYLIILGSKRLPIFQNVRESSHAIPPIPPLAQTMPLASLVLCHFMPLASLLLSHFIAQQVCTGVTGSVERFFFLSAVRSRSRRRSRRAPCAPARTQHVPMRWLAEPPHPQA
jgi:hypothetical protein